MPPVDRDRRADLLRAEDVAVGTGSAGVTAASLGIRPGESVVLVGSQRARAEALLRCLAGIVKPRRGRVMFGDTAVSEWTDTERARLRRTVFAVVSDPRPTDYAMSVLDFVARPLRVTGSTVEQARSRAIAALDEADARHLAGRLMSDLDPVDVRLTTIARAWTAAPVVTFAVAPTDGLDSGGGRRVSEVLTTARHHPGSTLVTVTEDPELSGRMDRRIAC